MSKCGLIKNKPFPEVRASELDYFKGWGEKLAETNKTRGLYGEIEESL